MIVQDGDNPKTAELLKEWLAKDRRIRYIPRGVVGSIADASNAGLDMARGEYIAILDDDDAWSLPEKLALQVDFLDCHADYVACGGGYVLIDQNGRRHGAFLKPEQDGAIRSRALLANPIANSTAIFRRVIGGRPALYDTSLRGYADWDFWLMLGTLGKLYNLPRCVTNYALWEGGGSFRQQKVNARAAIRILLKHRRSYSSFPLAFLLSCLHYCYACLPVPLRRVSYHSLSALKKALASSNRKAAGEGN